MNDRHCYVITLEVTLPQKDKTYELLPLHTTIMYSFWVTLTPDELMSRIAAPLSEFSAATFIPGPATTTGSLGMPAHELTDGSRVQAIHMELYDLLKGLDAEFVEPNKVGENYRPHISERRDAVFMENEPYMATTAYLIEVQVPGYGTQRLVRSRLDVSRS